MMFMSESRGARIWGRQTARVTIVEFSDFQCPYCKLFDRGPFKRLRDEYVNTGKCAMSLATFPFRTLIPSQRRLRKQHCAQASRENTGNYAIFCSRMGYHRSAQRSLIVPDPWGSR